MSIDCTFQNLTGSSGSYGYFSPTALWILWIWTYTRLTFSRHTRTQRVTCSFQDESVFWMNHLSEWVNHSLSHKDFLFFILFNRINEWQNMVQDCLWCPLKKKKKCITSLSMSERKREFICCGQRLMTKHFSFSKSKCMLKTEWQLRLEPVYLLILTSWGRKWMGSLTWWCHPVRNMTYMRTQRSVRARDALLHHEPLDGMSCHLS